ncbi:hypothetical protein Sango_3013800 [Sesamum angolense]|uniref:Hydroxyproline-rich glycoprotein family protein n=1 Tax=Sesamum angolense TaxID=2727404 RepID=A0AAE1VZC3_9LAMI|nr:hypothetical protein Sango_3013800 [Sesamum angolense]
MRGKSCSSESQNGAGAPHLSGAYIRSLVKQLTSSRSTKDSSDSNENLEGGGRSASGPADGVSDKQGKPRQPKKQVRRRAHASRPYQDSLLNMAEARREIVTALKLHRAAMKQAREKQQLEQVKESGPEVPPVGPASSHQSRRNPRIYASNSSSSSDNFPANYAGDGFAYSPGFYSPYSWPVSPIAPPQLVQETLNLQLPSQTLGLNLNLQDFENLDMAAFHCSTNPSSNFSSSSPSTSSSPALSAATEEIPHALQAQTWVAENGDSGLHFGHQWNADSVNSEEYWFKFLNSMEIGPEEQKDEDLVSSPFDDQVMEFPAWLNANESFSQHVTDFCSDDSFQDLALPCMDIQEIEGIDGDWLA